MIHNEAAKAAAIQTLLESGVNALPVTDTQIISMIKQCGFKVISYGYPLSESVKKDFEDLGLTATAEKYSGFTYCGNNGKYVFIRGDLSFTERTKVLAHELGHIKMKHIIENRFFCNTNYENRHPQEIEANAFALELLAPTCILKHIPFITPAKIARYTQTDISTAEHIFFNVRLSRFQRMAAAEKKLCRIFKQHKKTKRNDTQNGG